MFIIIFTVIPLYHYKEPGLLFKNIPSIIIYTFMPRQKKQRASKPRARRWDIRVNGSLQIANSTAKQVGIFLQSSGYTQPILGVVEQLQMDRPHTFHIREPASLGGKMKLIQVTPSTSQQLKGNGFFDWMKKAGSAIASAAQSVFSEPKPEFTGAVNKVSEALFKPSGEDPADQNEASVSKTIHDFRVGPGLPDTKTLYEMNKAAYANSNTNVGDWHLVKNTPTLQFFKKDNTIVIAVRGTADKADVIADINIGLQNLAGNSRYLDDVREINNFQTLYPTISYNYYLTGHSLGGAICDLLLKAGLAQQAITFNPAVQKEFYGSTNNRRIYNDDDPLFRMMGKYTSNKEVRTRTNQGELEKMLGNQSYAGQAYTALKAHSLDNFVGGMASGLLHRPAMRSLGFGMNVPAAAKKPQHFTGIGGSFYGDGDFFDSIKEPLAGNQKYVGGMEAVAVAPRPVWRIRGNPMRSSPYTGELARVLFDYEQPIRDGRFPPLAVINQLEDPENVKSVITFLRTQPVSQTADGRNALEHLRLRYRNLTGDEVEGFEDRAGDLFFPVEARQALEDAAAALQRDGPPLARPPLPLTAQRRTQIQKPNRGP
jgi:hypothetical protein